MIVKVLPTTTDLLSVIQKYLNFIRQLTQYEKKNFGFKFNT